MGCNSSASSSSTSDGGGLEGKPAPDFEITFIDGSKKSLSELWKGGKPVVIDFYANF